jgi:hypothetical protein
VDDSGRKSPYSKYINQTFTKIDYPKRKYAILLEKLIEEMRSKGEVYCFYCKNKFKLPEGQIAFICKNCKGK